MIQRLKGRCPNCGEWAVYEWAGQSGARCTVCTRISLIRDWLTKTTGSLLCCHLFIPGDSMTGWTNECSHAGPYEVEGDYHDTKRLVTVIDPQRQCGYPRQAHAFPEDLWRALLAAEEEGLTWLDAFRCLTDPDNWDDEVLRETRSRRAEYFVRRRLDGDTVVVQDQVCPHNMPTGFRCPQCGGTVPFTED